MDPTEKFMACNDANRQSSPVSGGAGKTLISGDFNAQDTSTDIFQELAQIATKQQGFSFSSLKEAEQQTEKNLALIRQQTEHATALFLEGLQLLSETGQNFVATTSKKLLDQVHTPEKIVQIITDDIANNDKALEQYSDAVNDFYDCGDYHTEECAIAVLLTLFPLHPQPYACFGTLLWRRDGVTVAQAFYEQIVDTFNDPVLDYFGGHCLLNATDKTKAITLLKRAYTAAQAAPGQYSELLPLIQSAMQQSTPVSV